MKNVNRNAAPTFEEIIFFSEAIDFSVPEEFIIFFKETNGGDIVTDERCVLLWELKDMVQLNIDYNVEEYVPEFFIFGTDGGGNAFAIEKSTGNIYEMPFIGMSKEDSVFISNSFIDFIASL